MSSQDFVKLGLQIAAMLACALFFGQLLRRFRQPAVVGEMLGGIFLGPTVFALLAPAAYSWLFASSANAGPMMNYLLSARKLTILGSAATTK